MWHSEKSGNKTSPRVTPIGPELRSPFSKTHTSNGEEIVQVRAVLGVKPPGVAWPGEPIPPDAPISSAGSLHAACDNTSDDPANRIALPRRFGHGAFRSATAGTIQPRASPPAKRRSPRSWPGTDRWFCTFATRHWVTGTMPRMPSRPCFSYWLAKPCRSATLTFWETGSTVSPSARPRRPATSSTASAKTRRETSSHGLLAVSVWPSKQYTSRRLDESALIREQAEALYGEIDRLSPSFRQPVVLHYFEGLTVEDTAHRLRCPAGTVRSRLARACEKLRAGA